MGFTRRIRRIIKGYLKTARERLDELEAELARRELEQSLEPGGTLRTDTQPTARRAPSTDAPSAAAPNEPVATEQVPEALMAYYRMLGLAPQASLEDLERAYESLMKRADPNRFPDGSEERRRAEEIQRRIQQAYTAIRDHMDTTYARFKRISP